MTAGEGSGPTRGLQRCRRPTCGVAGRSHDDLGVAIDGWITILANRRGFRHRDAKGRVVVVEDAGLVFDTWRTRQTEPDGWARHT